MKNTSDKPTPEAKALSLFLMAFKATKPVYKEQSNRIHRLWGLVTKEEMSSEEYLEKVNSMLKLNGGYLAVVEKTVRHYIDKDDKYCKDAQEIADNLLKK